MVEIFKTNITNRSQADRVTALIQHSFNGHRATIDLEDCDKVLRVSSRSGLICPHSMIRLVEDFGFRAEILQDVPQFSELQILLA